MINISKSQIKNLYSIASRTGILESGNKDDSFHNLVERETGKKSVSKLTISEYAKVKSKMLSIQGNFKSNDVKNKKTYKKKNISPITDGQINKIWYLMYEFEKLSPSKYSLGSRLKGIIKRQLGIDVGLKEPFIWLESKDGYKLIEILKKYINSKKQNMAD